MIEKDNQLCNLLKEKYKKLKNIYIQNIDAIDFDYKTFVRNKNLYLKRYYPLQPLQSEFYNINKIPKWLIVNEKEYKRFLIKKKINLFIYLMHKNTSNIPNELYYLMY